MIPFHSGLSHTAVIEKSAARERRVLVKFTAMEFGADVEGCIGEIQPVFECAIYKAALTVKLGALKGDVIERDRFLVWVMNVRVKLGFAAEYNMTEARITGESG